MKVPLLDLEAHHEPLSDEILGAFEKVIRSRAFILGPEVQRLEERIAEYCGTRFAIGVSSGTDALLVSLMAIGVGAGAEVISSPYSFFATAGSIARLGAKPVFVDIDPLTFNIDPQAIEAAVTPRTKAILPVHLFGQCSDMGRILDVADKHGLPVIEDAAQAIGAQYADGRRAGSMGILGCLSFYPSKNLGALGDAGMVVTNSPQLADNVRILREHGSKPKYYHHRLGGNFRLDSLQAAALNVKMDYLDSWTSKRQEKAEGYFALFRESGLGEKIPLHLPAAVYRSKGVDHYHIYNQFVIRIEARDELRAYLLNAGVATGIYYPVPLHLQRCFEDLGYRQGDFPESERASRESLALPVYPELNSEQQKFVVETIRDFYCS